MPFFYQALEISAQTHHYIISTHCLPFIDTLILLQTCSIKQYTKQIKIKTCQKLGCDFVGSKKPVYTLQDLIRAFAITIKSKTGFLLTKCAYFGNWFWFARKKRCIHQVLDSFGFQRCGFHLCAFSRHSKSSWFMQLQFPIHIQKTHKLRTC